MGNCCSDVAGGRAAIGGTAGGLLNPADAPNDAVDNFLRSRGYHGLFSQIELSFSASGLRDRDVLSKSDPMMVLYARGKNGALEELGRTEVILNSLNPTWITKHTLIYHFEVVQVLVFRVYDVDTQFHNADVKMLKLEEQQFLGEATCALSEIITKLDRSLTLDLHREDSIRSSHSQNCGKLLVHAEECINSKTTIEMILRCSDLEYRDLFSKSDPFLLVSKVVEGGTNVPICKTEVIKNDHNPTWKPVFLNIQQVGSKESPLIIECYNFNSNGKHDLMGKVQRSLVELEKLYSGGQGESLFLPAAAGHNSHNKVKLTKTKAYFKRYQTQYRRRREGKTDYYARKRMVYQDLNKYLAPRYRLVARITNSKVIAQIAYSTLAGDKILCQADSRELQKWGLKTGFTSYPAAYGTGLLLARRLLKQLNIADLYKGAKTIDGNAYDVSGEASADRRPFKAVLDIGIRRPTVGNRVFAVLKGATDGGLHVPHSINRFPGFVKGDTKDKNSYDAEAHRARIFGGHIDEYMDKLKEAGEEGYKKQFNKWDQTLKAAGVEGVEDLFEKIFEGIRNAPGKDKKKTFKPTLAYSDERKTIVKVGAKTFKRDRRLTHDERKANIQKKIAIAETELAKHK